MSSCNSKSVSASWIAASLTILLNFEDGGFLSRDRAFGDSVHLVIAYVTMSGHVLAIFGSRSARSRCVEPLSRSFPITITTIADIDQASRVLAQGRLVDTPRTYAALAEQGDVPLSTLHHRARGRPSKETKAQRQQYLTPEEEKAVIRFFLLMSTLGQPIRIKFIPSLAFRVARRRSTNKPIKPPGKN